MDKYKGTGHWIFGCLCYDLKNEIEALSSQNPDSIGFPVLHFFVPRHLVIGHADHLEIVSGQPADTWKAILNYTGEQKVPVNGPLHLTYIPGRDNYIREAGKLLEHIRYGNIYEVNYCHQLQLESKELDAAGLFRKLCSISPNPFACFYRTRDHHLFCASPERFLAKRGSQLLSQPVKGTAPRDADLLVDRENLERLLASEKERSENIMIADLVRNDLSKVAEKGTVKAEEICGAYTFSRVH